MKNVVASIILCVLVHAVASRYVGSIEELKEKNKDLLKLAGVADVQSFPQQVSRIIDLADAETGDTLGPYRTFLCAVVAENSASFETGGYRAADDDIAPQVTKCEYDRATKVYTVDYTYTDINGRKNQCTGSQKELYKNPDFTSTIGHARAKCSLVKS